MFAARRPNRLARVANRATVVLATVGLAPRRLAVLRVRGRRTGRQISLPVVVADHEGRRYLVAMLGDESNWVRNVRVNRGVAELRHGRHRHTVWLTEVGMRDRPAILKRYLRLAPGARAHIPLDPTAPTEAFERIAAAYPVFRIDADPAVR